MNPIIVSMIMFTCVFGGALLGMFLSPKLPEHHLSNDSRQIVNLAMGIIGTMAALVLGLLVASAKNSFDTRNNELIEVSAKVAMLDRVLAHYGPESKDARDQLRETVSNMIERLWPKSQVGPFVPRQTGGERVYDTIEEFSPSNETQKSQKEEALGLAMSLGQTRWLMFAQADTAISSTLLVLLIFWFTINFVSLGLFAPRNATVTAALFLCALAVSGAILLILEMYKPFSGLIQISDAPLRDVLAQLGR